MNQQRPGAHHPQCSCCRIEHRVLRCRALVWGQRALCGGGFGGFRGRDVRSHAWPAPSRCPSPHAPGDVHLCCTWCAAHRPIPSCSRCPPSPRAVGCGCMCQGTGHRMSTEDIRSNGSSVPSAPSAGKPMDIHPRPPSAVGYKTSSASECDMGYVYKRFLIVLVGHKNKRFIFQNSSVNPRRLT